MEFLYSNEDAELAQEAGWYQKQGYVCRNVPTKRDPTKRTTQRFHVVVMCRMLGIDKLEKSKVVHHKNENTNDNRRENLELMEISKHISHHHKGKKKPYLIERNQSEWMKDKLRGNKYGTALAGDKNGKSKITDEQWLEGIDNLFKGIFKTNAELARHFGIQKTQVGYVLKGKSRKHLQSQIRELCAFYGRE